MFLRKVHVIFLCVTCYSALGIFMIMNTLLASNLHNVNRSDMEAKLIANVVMEVGNLLEDSNVFEENVIQDDSFLELQVHLKKTNRNDLYQKDAQVSRF